MGVRAYATSGAGPADLGASLPDRDDVSLRPGGRGLLGIGLRLAIPTGYEVQFSRGSGLALRLGITGAQAPGTIASDYRGPLGAILLITDTEDFGSRRRDRIALMIVAHVDQADFAEVSKLDTTPRGAGGFGSTGWSS